MSGADKANAGVRNAEGGIPAAYSGCFFSPVSGAVGGTSAGLDSVDFGASGFVASGGMVDGAAVAGGGKEVGGGTGAPVPRFSMNLERLASGRSGMLFGRP